MSRKVMKRVDLVNKKFGELLVIEKLSASRGGSRLWRCLCSCGNIVQVSTRHLNRKDNNVRSCGCKKKIKGKKHSQWKGYGDISGAWWSTRVMRSTYNYKGRPSIPVTITKKQAWELFLKQDKKCALSGLPLIIDKTEIGTASLDRIDSNLGYEINNVQWVHKDINFMKRTYTQDYFIELCKKVVQNTVK